MAFHLAYLADGHNYHVKKWVRAIAETGAHVTLITFRPPEETIPNVSIERLPIRLGTKERYSYLNYLLAVRRVRSILKRINPDVLLGSYATHYGWVAARTGFHPFALQTWTFDLTSYPFKGAKRLVFGPIVRYSLTAADLVTTDGPALLAEGTRLYPHLADKFESIRWGIRLSNFRFGEHERDHARSKLSIPEKAVVITSPRGLLPVYRSEIVLPVLEKLLAAHQDFYAIVLTLGHSPTESTRTLLNRLATHPRVQVLDRFLDVDEMRNIWSATDIVVSIPHSDGISESLLEAVYSGAYPVMSDIVSNRSLVDEGIRGTLVPEPPASQLEEAIVKAAEKCRESDTTTANRNWIKNNAAVESTAHHLIGLLQSL